MLLNLINDLLDLAKNDENTFTLSKSFFSLKSVVLQTFSVLDFMAKQKQVQLKLIIPQNQEKFFEKIYGDQNRYE